MNLNVDPRLPVFDKQPDFLPRLIVRLTQLWRTLALTINQREAIELNGTIAGIAPTLNFIAGAGISIAVEADNANGKINITISSAP